jgi:adenosylcobinamide kinase/adenosylcobinamide-phosphate guanylyltransferase
MRTLITGGVKSGKSSRALQLAAGFTGPRHFLATATAFDDEMRDRIARHRAERADAFVTIEETIDIDRALRDNMIVDCIPMWLNNLFYLEREPEWEAILQRFIVAMPAELVIVTNETGMGVIPSDPLSRRYGMVLGLANAMLATAVDRVELMVAGLPLRVK